MLARFQLSDRSDQQVLAGAKALVGQEREATAQLIAHLSEIDARDLYLGEGCPSLFKYCTEILHLSEAAAGNRIIVARLARRFPTVLERLADGSIHLSALRILAPCLTLENHTSLLDAAKHKSKEEVEQLAATVRPRPDVPSVVRKLPERGSLVSSTHPDETELFGQKPDDTPPSSSSGIPNPPGEDPIPEESIPEVPVLPTPLRRGTVTALSPGRYKIEFTADAETHQALRQLQELMRHQVPSGDPAKIFKTALLLLLEQVREEKTGQVKRPRKRKAGVSDLWDEEAGGAHAEWPTQNAETTVPEAEPAGKPGTNESRHIPAEVKRSVWNRDKGQCTFVGRNGRRCTATGWLEFHHVHAYALGGAATIDNIALRCRAHNAYESRVLFAGNGKKLTRPGACSSASARNDKHSSP